MVTFSYFYSYRFLEIYSICFLALGLTYVLLGVAAQEWFYIDAQANQVAVGGSIIPLFQYQIIVGMYEGCRNNVQVPGHIDDLYYIMCNQKTTQPLCCFDGIEICANVVERCPLPAWYEACRGFQVLCIVAAMIAFTQVGFNILSPLGGSILSGAIINTIAAFFGMLATIIFATEYKSFPFYTTPGRLSPNVAISEPKLQAAFYFYLVGWIFMYCSAALGYGAHAKKKVADKNWVVLKKDIPRAQTQANMATDSFANTTALDPTQSQPQQGFVPSLSQANAAPGADAPVLNGNRRYGLLDDDDDTDYYDPFAD